MINIEVRNLNKQQTNNLEADLKVRKLGCNWRIMS
jgi:hypothetical protein